MAIDISSGASMRKQAASSRIFARRLEVAATPRDAATRSASRVMDQAWRVCDSGIGFVFLMTPTHNAASSRLYFLLDPEEVGDVAISPPDAQGRPGRSAARRLRTKKTPPERGLVCMLSASRGSSLVTPTVGFAQGSIAFTGGPAGRLAQLLQAFFSATTDFLYAAAHFFGHLSDLQLEESPELLLHL